MVEFTGLASRVRDFEPARGAAGRGGGRSGLKIVVENRNIYEGQYMRVEHVVPERCSASGTPPKPVGQAIPGWMGAPRLGPSGGRGQSGRIAGRSTGRMPLLSGR